MKSQIKSKDNMNLKENTILKNSNSKFKNVPTNAKF